ncbi:MAG TPA: DUF4118 domain-containing protein, partial [Ilumatobacteraceae bacterium]|nr:DUF4118 domain-containing protein [Ilumatobacteraceae bacterium]
MSPRGVDSPALSHRRRVISLIVGAVAFLVLTLPMVALRGDVDVSTALGLYLLVVVAVAAIGGSVPGVIAAVVALLLVNWFLVEPYHTLRVSDAGNVVELIVFVTVALVVSTFVSIAARRSTEAEQARREATSLARLAGSSGPDAMQLIIDELCASFELDGVSVVDDRSGTPMIVAASGANPPASRADADFADEFSDGVVVAMRGRTLSAD